MEEKKADNEDIHERRRLKTDLDDCVWKWINMENHQVRNVPKQYVDDVPEVVHWYELKNVSLDNPNRFHRVGDAISSIFIRNDNDVELNVKFIVGPFIGFQKTLPAHSMQVYELFSEPLPYCALQLADHQVIFSARPTTVLFRHIMWRDRIAVSKCYESTVVSSMSSKGVFFYNVDGRIQTENWPDLSIEAAQDKVDEHFSYLPFQSHASRRRLYSWSPPLTETKRGIYTFPPGHQCYSSIFVINPGSRPIRLKLRPEPFRHDYLLLPGPNVFDLFWQEFWVPCEGSWYFTCECSGLQIQLRCGNQCPPHKNVLTTYQDISPVLVSEFSGDAYIRSDRGLKFASSNGRRQQAIQTILLGMHARVGAKSRFRQYFLEHYFSERFLVPVIWDFL